MQSGGPSDPGIVSPVGRGADGPQRPGGWAAAGPDTAVPGDAVDGAGQPAALPVALSLRGRHADAVRRWTEGVLGWQPVETDTGELMPPRVELADPAGLAARSVPPRSGPPLVLLVDDEAVSTDDVRAAVRATPAAVLGWPGGRDRLAAVVKEVTARSVVRPGAGEVLRVGGASGGAGVTTVCLALAGQRAWAGLRTVVSIRSAAPGPREITAAAMADPVLWEQATPLTGVPAGRAVRQVDLAEPAATTDPRIDAVVLDLGVERDVDVLVCRPDAAGVHALASTTAAAFVLVGEGPATPAALRDAASGRRGIRLPWSARVARAGHLGRLPAGLPGAWLRRLEPLGVPTRS